MRREPRRARAGYELRRRCFRVLRSEFSCTAEVAELQFGFSHFFSAAKLRQRAFKNGVFITEPGRCEVPPLQKSSSKAVRNTTERQGCKREVVAFDRQRFETITL